MKGKFLAAALTVVVGLTAFFSASQAQARITPEAAVENMFAEINSGEVEAALAAFSEDAIARNVGRGDSYIGSSEIRQMLAEMHKEGRRLEVVSARAAGEKTVVTVEISDDGLVWGTEWFTVELKNGKIHYFELTTIRLKF